MQSQSKLIINKRAIKLLLIFAVLATAIFGYFIYDFIAQAKAIKSEAIATSQYAPEPLEPVVALTEPEPIAEAEVAPAVQSTQRVAVETPAPAPTQSVTSDMTSADIDLIDQPIAQSLLFPNGSWDVSGCFCARHLVHIADPVARLARVNIYVVTKYGTWSAAQAQAVEGQW